MSKLTVRDTEVQGKRALVRVDFNVPLQNGVVADDTRIRASIPTLRYLLDAGASVVVCSHLGRPQGQVREELRMAPVGARLQEVLERPVKCASDCVGRPIEKQARKLGRGELLLLENLRFRPEEEANDREFAWSLAQLGDFFVNDAFGASHRAHASTEGVAHFLGSVAGLLLEDEVERLGAVFRTDAGTRAVISGGAKISDKLALLRHLVERIDVLCIGGAMAHTFLLARGVGIGASLAEPELVEEAGAVLAEAERRGCVVELPIDGVIAQAPEGPPQARPVVFGEEEVPAGWRILDIGPATIERFADALRSATVVVWNGPLGLFETPAFAGGTMAIARLIAELPAESIVCGGESVQAVRQAGVAEQISHISTGGGAALEFLEGRSLPGLAVLPDRA